jgi:hypothetical protein
LEKPKSEENKNFLVLKMDSAKFESCAKRALRAILDFLFTVPLHRLSCPAMQMAISPLTEIFQIYFS